MNWLLEQLPDKVLVDGTEYLVDSDFRAILLIDQIMHDKELSDTQRVISALTIFYGQSTQTDHTGNRKAGVVFSLRKRTE